MQTKVLESKLIPVLNPLSMNPANCKFCTTLVTLMTSQKKGPPMTSHSNKSGCKLHVLFPHKGALIQSMKVLILRKKKKTV